MASERSLSVALSAHVQHVKQCHIIVFPINISPSYLLLYTRSIAVEILHLLHYMRRQYEESSCSSAVLGGGLELLENGQDALYNLAA